MRIELSKIIGVESQRDEGDITALAESIKREGLLQPLVINQNNELICGRRRYRALIQLGTIDTEAYQIKTDDDIDKLSKAIAENIQRKNLTWQEEVEAKKELDELMRLKYGSVKEGERTDLTGAESAAVKWSTIKTAELLNEPERTTQTDIQLAKAIEENPELEKCKTKKEAIQRIRKQRINKEIKEKTKEFKELDSIQIWQGDCFGLINKLDNNSVDLLITDPPYNITENKWDRIGTREEYIKWFEEWFKMLIPKYKDKFNGFIFCDPDYFADLELVIRKYYPIKSRIIWQRMNMAKGRIVQDRFISSYDFIFHFGTNELNFPEKWGDERFDVQRFAVPQTNFKDTKLHPTQKPLELIKRFVELGSNINDLVIDVFGGSGTTGVACKELKRQCILIEQEQEYMDIIKGRLAQI